VTVNLQVGYSSVLVFIYSNREVPREIPEFPNPEYLSTHNRKVTNKNQRIHAVRLSGFIVSLAWNVEIFTKNVAVPAFRSKLVVAYRTQRAML
jgi:hypothetical protein